MNEVIIIIVHCVAVLDSPILKANAKAQWLHKTGASKSEKNQLFLLYFMVHIRRALRVKCNLTSTQRVKQKSA